MTPAGPGVGGVGGASGASSAADRKASNARAVTGSAPELGETVWWPDKTIMILMVFLLASSILRGTVNGGLSGELMSPPLAQDALSIAYAGLMLGFVMVPAARRRPGLAGALTVIVLFAGILLMSVLGAEHSGVGAAVMMTGRTCLSPLLWILLVGEVGRSGARVERVFALCFIACDLLSSLLGYLVVPLVMGALGAAVEQPAPLLAAAMAFVMIAASALVSGVPS